LQSDGTYRYVKKAGRRLQSQRELYEQACETVRINNGSKRARTRRS